MYAVAATLAGTAAAPGLVQAQEAGGVRREGLEEVLVTAQRREQALQDVPLALQVVGTDLIADTAAEDLGDLNGFVPGLLVSSDSPTQPRYQIRGIQTGDFGVGTDPAVGVFVDGIYAARSGASLLAFNDIERIEVLKGPQGTLFGRNSAAGAISIVTRQPADTFEAWLRLRVGDYNKRRVEGMVNLPIGDSFALRVNGVLNKQRRLGRGCRDRQGPLARGQLGRPCGAALGHLRRHQRHAHLGPRPARPAGAAGDRPDTGRPRAATRRCRTRRTPAPFSTRATPGSTTTCSATRSRAPSTS